MKRFDLFAERSGIGGSSDAAAPSTAPTSNGRAQNHDSVTPAVPSPPAQSSSPQKRQAESDDQSDPSTKTPPAKKKKPDHDIDADALYAAKLQAEENMRARPTRGASARRAAPVKKKTKTKTSKKVKAEDDSDLDTGSETKKEVNRSGGFHVSFQHSSRMSVSTDNQIETIELVSGAFGIAGRRGYGTLFLTPRVCLFGIWNIC